MSRRISPRRSTALDLWYKCNDQETRATEFFLGCWQFDQACVTRNSSERVSVSRIWVPKAD